MYYRDLRPDSLVFQMIIRTIIISLFLVSSGCEQALHKESFRPDMLVENYTTTNYKESKIDWKLEAKKASYYYSEKKSIAENIILNYYKDNKPSAVIKADSAVINTDSKDIDLAGNVDMISTEGNRLLTSKIRWNNSRNYLDTDEPVKIIRKNGDIINGIGLRADYSLDSYEIKKKVIAVSSKIGDSLKKNKEKEKK
jgi:LPS export ABC transporter protein LptC